MRQSLVNAGVVPKRIDLDPIKSRLMLASCIVDNIFKGEVFVGMAVGIDGNRFPAGAAQELIHGLRLRFTLQIPQRGFYPGNGA